jgi:hypothetical protein
MTIQITDSAGFFTVMGCGSKSHKSVKSAVQIKAWKGKKILFLGNRNASLPIQPFSHGSGDSLFDTGSLFCFQGSRNKQSENVLMVLWGFKLSSATGDTGDGQLNDPTSAGMLQEGTISWEILAM